MLEPLAIANIAVLLITIGVTALAFRRPDFDLQRRLIFCPRRILAGREMYRMVSLALLHADWRHLCFNMISLYLFGRMIELLYGPASFLMIYLGGILGGSLLCLFLHRNHEYTAYGASGGVCGVIFASLFLLPGGGIVVFPIPVAIPIWLYAILFLVGSFYALKNRNDGIGHDAHIGGAISGLLIATALHPWIVVSSPYLYAATLTLSVSLMAYLLINPLFLPARAFLPTIKHPRVRRSVQTHRPRYKQIELETDRILEKVSVSGLESLTAHERIHLKRMSIHQQRRREWNEPEF